MNDLAKELEANSGDPRAADALLSAAWKELKGTRGHQALEIFLASLHTHLTTTILHINASSEARAFASGQLKTCQDLSNVIKAALEFDPAKAEYEDELSGDEDSAGPEEVVY